MWPEGDSVSEDEELARRGGRGRKLQAEFGRFATSVKISDMRRCCIDVSCRKFSMSSLWTYVCKDPNSERNDIRAGYRTLSIGVGPNY